MKSIDKQPGVKHCCTETSSNICYVFIHFISNTLTTQRIVLISIMMMYTNQITDRNSGLTSLVLSPLFNFVNAVANNLLQTPHTR